MIPETKPLRRLLVTLASICLAAPMFPGLASLARAQGEDDGPRLVNAARETQTVSGGLGGTIQAIAGRSEGAEWIGYGVERVAGQRSACCGNYNDGELCGTCRLEGEQLGFTTGTNGTTKLEGRRRLVVLLRVENRKVMRVRLRRRIVRWTWGICISSGLRRLKRAKAWSCSAGMCWGRNFKTTGTMLWERKR